MSSSFAELVEEIKTLSVSEKEELQQLIERYLIEERRDEILDSYVHSLTELEEGKLEFSNDADTLKELLLNRRDNERVMIDPLRPSDSEGGRNEEHSHYDLLEG